MLKGNVNPVKGVIAMIKSLILAAACLSLVTPALAAKPTPETVRFTHKGVDYEYKVIEKDDGTRTIKGAANGGRDVFVLKVRGERVSGSINGQHVSFSTKSLVKVSEPAVQIASD
jgi:hypothetical protein